VPSSLIPDGEPAMGAAFGRVVSENRGLSFKLKIPERNEAR
jgi:hypothetical protein